MIKGAGREGLGQVEGLWWDGRDEFIGEKITF